MNDVLQSLGALQAGNNILSQYRKDKDEKAKNDILLGKMIDDNSMIERGQQGGQSWLESLIKPAQQDTANVYAPQMPGRDEVQSQVMQIMRSGGGVDENATLDRWRSQYNGARGFDLNDPNKRKAALDEAQRRGWTVNRQAMNASDEDIKREVDRRMGEAQKMQGQHTLRNMPASEQYNYTDRMFRDEMSRAGNNQAKIYEAVEKRNRQIQNLNARFGGERGQLLDARQFVRTGGGGGQAYTTSYTVIDKDGKEKTVNTVMHGLNPDDTTADARRKLEAQGLKIKDVHTARAGTEDSTKAEELRQTERAKEKELQKAMIAFQMLKREQERVNNLNRVKRLFDPGFQPVEIDGLKFMTPEEIAEYAKLNPATGEPK